MLTLSANNAISVARRALSISVSESRLSMRSLSFFRCSSTTSGARSEIFSRISAITPSRVFMSDESLSPSRIRIAISSFAARVKASFISSASADLSSSASVTETMSVSLSACDSVRSFSMPSSSAACRAAVIYAESIGMFISTFFESFRVLR